MKREYQKFIIRRQGNLVYESQMAASAKPMETKAGNNRFRDPPC